MYFEDTEVFILSLIKSENDSVIRFYPFWSKCIPNAYFSESLMS